MAMTKDELNRLCAEVMGFELQTNYLKAVAKGQERPLAWHNSKGKLLFRVEDWNPYDNPEQALMCANELLAQRPELHMTLDSEAEDDNVVMFGERAVEGYIIHGSASHKDKIARPIVEAIAQVVSDTQGEG